MSAGAKEKGSYWRYLHLRVLLRLNNKRTRLLKPIFSGDTFMYKP
jgi:hypothetical protein